MAKGTPSPSPSAEASAVKANAEILTEMFQVVFQQKEIEDQTLFASLVSTLDQGASLEGIYRGLVMGSRYRVLESKARAASPESIKFFASEMGELQPGMRSPTTFTKDTAKLFPTIDFPEGVESAGGQGAGTGQGSDGEGKVVEALGKDGPDSLTFGDDSKPAANIKPSPTSAPHIAHDQSKKSQKEIVDEMMQDFIGATPFTLKRVLCEEVMEKMDEIKGSPGELAQWYATFVVRMAATGVDFGLAQRNSVDFDFHFRFAKIISFDRLKWEVLNRYQRVLNQLN